MFVVPEVLLRSLVGVSLRRIGDDITALLTAET
jgi:hypothetical protein